METIIHSADGTLKSQHQKYVCVDFKGAIRGTFISEKDCPRRIQGNYVHFLVDEEYQHMISSLIPRIDGKLCYHTREERFKPVDD